MINTAAFSRARPGRQSRFALRTALLATVLFPAAAGAAAPATASAVTPGLVATGAALDTTDQIAEQGQVAEQGSQPADEATASDDASDDIVVTGARASRRLSLERKRTAESIRDVVSSDLVGKLPDYNTAEALQRLPGVSTEIDQSEARYVVIRGVDPNLNQVTVDGNLVGVPEAEGRRVALDTIPSDLVAAIEVVKAVTPDFDANAVGGSINIITPTAFDRPGDILFLRAQATYGDKAKKWGYGGAATYGARFGSADTFGIVVAGSYFKRFIDSDLAEPVSWTTLAPGVVSPTSYRFYDYRIMRERIGAILNLDWRPSPDVRFYVRNIYNEFTDEEGRDQFDFNFARGALTVNGPDDLSFSRGRATREFRQNDQTQKLYNISPGGEFDLGSATVSLNYVYARAEEVTPVRDDIEFRSADNLGNRIDLSGDGLPTFVLINPALENVGAFPLRRLRIRDEDITEDLNAVRADLRFGLGGNENSFIKVGAKYTHRRKVRDNRQSEYLPVGTITSTTAGSVLPPPEDFYDNRFSFGPTIDYGAFIDFFEANPVRFTLNEAATFVSDRSIDYDIRERITAGYAMAQANFGALTAIAGVRVEQTKARNSAFAIRDTDGDGVLEPSDLQPLTFDNSYTDVLPSIHLNYRPRRDLVFRAAWTNTLGRPNYDVSVPTFSEDDGEGSAGNPELKPFRSMGLDLSAEYYPDSESIVSAAIFYKKIRNPIFTRTIQDTSFAGIPLLSLSQPQNAEDGYLLGLEGNFQRRLTFLPAPLDGFGVSINGTYVRSEVEVPGRESETIPFFRQSDWILNAALFYEKGPFEARLAVNYRDDYIVNIGNGVVSDIYNKARTVLDARVSYRLVKGAELFGTLSNFTDAPLTFYQTRPDQIYSRQIYSYYANVGVSLSF